jgi:hypothetical protein
MKKTFTLLAFPVLLLFSCKKNNTSVISKGLYIEITPAAGRSQLNFIGNNLVVRSEKGSSVNDTFSYVFSAGKITLTPTWTNQYPGEQLDFNKIDDNTLQIENFYPQPPEDPETFIIYKK